MRGGGRLMDIGEEGGVDRHEEGELNALSIDGRLQSYRISRYHASAILNI